MLRKLLENPERLFVVEEDEVAHSVKTSPELESLLLLEVGSQLEGAQEPQLCELMDQYISAPVN